MTTVAALPGFDIERVLAGIDTMGVRSPAAAQVLAVAAAEDASAAELAQVLAADVALAGRVMKLANSSYFGMRGRVTSLPFAVTVVGFATVRTMATVALAELDDGDARLPGDFWEVTTTLGLATATLAPRFGKRSPDGWCLGLLAQLGMALLCHHDPAGHAELRAGGPSFAELRAAETQRYGISALRLTAVALEQWGFAREMVTALTGVEDAAAPEGALLRAAFEVTGRLTFAHHEPVPVDRLTGGLLREDALPAVLEQIRADAEELRRAMLGQPGAVQSLYGVATATASPPGG